MKKSNQAHHQDTQSTRSVSPDSQVTSQNLQSTSDAKPAVTRFAPSPTGYIHIGNVRSAIYPWLLARQTGGKFILRIEDTDRERYVADATERILDTLRWLGLEWDEGPLTAESNADAAEGSTDNPTSSVSSATSDTNDLASAAEVAAAPQELGDHGPYFQSERRAIYHEWARKLIAAGRAYADPTPPAQINAYREADRAAGRAFLYRHHRPENRQRDWQPGTPLRFLADPQPRHWHDAVMGDLSAGPEVQDDIILIKADGLPTYNFAHIVDDALMGVTHVIRGNEYLSSMPNYLALYEALGLTPPIFVSLPHILAPTGNKKLSKRDGAKSVTDYRADGILPEAMLNFLACLGWNDGSEQEIYTREELIAKFSLDHIQSSGARFDEAKLLWLNGQWLRRLATENHARLGDHPSAETLARLARNQIPGSDLATPAGIDALYARTAGFWPAAATSESDAYKKQVLTIIYDRLKTLGDLRTMTTYFFADPEINLELITGNKFLKNFSEAELAQFLNQAHTALAALPTSAWQATPSQDGVSAGTTSTGANNTNAGASPILLDASTLQTALDQLLATSGLKPTELFSLIRLALSYAPFSPALNLTLAVLGRDRSLARLKATASALVNDL